MANRLIDLTLEITDGMMVHPYDEEISLLRDKNIGDDGYVNHRLTAGMHTGTHIDAPMHMTLKRRYINDYPMEKFIGKAVVIDVRGEEKLILKDDYKEIFQEDDIVLFYTGHSQLFGQNSYYEEYPIMDEALAEFLVSRKIKMVGVDLPSPDKEPFSIHKILLEGDVLILENLGDMVELLDVENLRIIALPLNIRADASMARVVAEFEE